MPLMSLMFLSIAKRIYLMSFGHQYLLVSIYTDRQYETLQIMKNHHHIERIEMAETSFFDWLNSKSLKCNILSPERDRERESVHCPPSECCGVGPVSRELMSTRGIEVNSEQEQPFTFPIQRAPPPSPVSTESREVKILRWKSLKASGGLVIKPVQHPQSKYLAITLPWNDQQIHYTANNANNQLHSSIQALNPSLNICPTWNSRVNS